MKKVTMIAAMLIGLASFANKPTDVNDKVLKAFKQTFTSAKDVVWFEYGDSYTVNFKLAEIKTRINYDKDGNIIESFRYYGESQLPIHISNKIQKKFEGMKIFGVTERSMDNDVVFYVMLEGKKDWVEVKSDINGYLEVEQKFSKAE